MLLKKDIKEDLKEALKAGDSVAVLTLRSFISEIEKKEIELGLKEEGLSEGETEKIALSELKKRNEAKEQYEKAGRDELAEAEKKEALVLNKYVPEKMSDEELENIVNDIIKEKAPSGMQGMGEVMKEVMAKVKNRAEGSKVNGLVREKLENL
ncbi:MAG: GatB/YqeY domain-containing protein [Candidatus Spechtbacterales bacterium]